VTTPKTPTIRGQAGEVLALLREQRAVLSLELTADLAIPEAAARIHELRAAGFRILTLRQRPLEFRGRVRRGVAKYVLLSPEWCAPSVEEVSDATS
jgi:hypothetical protein